MPEPTLRSHIAKFITLSDAEAESIELFFTRRTVKKKVLLLEEGKKCNELYFVLDGCMRMFYLEEKGTEQTIQFAIENWWMTDLSSFYGDRSAEFSIQTIEETRLMCVDKIALEKLLTAHPKMERYFSIIYQKAYAASLLRVKYIFGMSKESFYNHFSSLYPEFLQRVPQYILASFLGLTPEYLSELRRKKLH